MKKISFQIKTILILSCLLLSTVLCAHAAPTLTAKQAQTLNNAYKEFQQGNFEKAISLSEEFVLAGEAHSFAYVIYGLANAQVGNYKKAIIAYETGMKLYPDDYTLKHNYGNALMKVNRNKEAARIFESILTQAPAEQRSQMRYLAAQNYYLGGDYKNAARLAEPLLQTQKIKKEILELVAISYSAAKNHAKAEQYLSLYVNLFPYEINAWNAYAGYSIGRNDLKKAGTLLELGNRINKNSKQKGRVNKYLPSLYANISAVRLEVMSLQEVIASTDKGSKNYKNLKEQELVAIINSGNYQKALNYIDKELSIKADSFLYYMKGTTYLRTFDYKKAEDAFRKGTAYSDRYGNISLYFLAMLYWENGEWQKAEIEFERLLQVKEYAQYAEHSLANLKQIQEELLLTTLEEN